ncbi:MULTISPECIES: Holliday junction branch migration protein RuvA [Pelosinus]|uniref:Holliday junction branch migration complex subunit RuvA n=1 Tax=Pelosinus fermentans B4 TaxID=1149862 RepID=I9LD83_9FIRM|nr:MULTISPECIES: Holliday junction branch migration protein RuvA [Pelosinus]EIW18384.1 Holliday junction DNA helicase RuvA [Pelosinus fermentans B4]EIW24397.1 Holliday junction ATP-dependent DNA helicase ruvA [Pelosinus fermentans A11]OAM94544.1 Holliday junction ATP-dependent DNA helicase ruvA [Pelosinus fermentans DSM 17108]SDR11834.1 Holliday junction DNA helicase subunit RuvA [Pelosinus fermentans]
MIGYVRGTVSHLAVDHCFIDVQGIGYRVFIAQSTRQKITIAAVVSLFTYMYVREDALMLYGFYTQDEYDLFLQLTSISGIGPKVAMGILSAIDPQQFRIAISQKNIGILTKLPGVGKKTAERVILELKDKIGLITEDDLNGDHISGISVSTGDVIEEALQALLALGYNQNEIMPVLKKIEKNGHSVEELLKLALREFVGGNR